MLYIIRILISPILRAFYTVSLLLIGFALGYAFAFYDPLTKAFAQESLLTKQDLSTIYTIQDKQEQLKEENNGKYIQVTQIYSPTKYVNVYSSPEGEGYQIIEIDEKTGTLYAFGYGPHAKEYTYETPVTIATTDISTTTDVR